MEGEIDDAWPGPFLAPTRPGEPDWPGVKQLELESARSMRATPGQGDERPCQTWPWVNFLAVVKHPRLVG